MFECKRQKWGSNAKGKPAPKRAELPRSSANQLHLLLRLNDKYVRIPGEGVLKSKFSIPNITTKKRTYEAPSTPPFTKKPSVYLEINQWEPTKFVRNAIWPFIVHPRLRAWALGGFLLKEPEIASYFNPSSTLKCKFRWVMYLRKL